MAIASLYPTIKPSLLLDFANSKKLDPRVTFTRSTTAVYYDGVTSAKAEENLLLQSQVFLPAPWTLTDAEPTGTLGSELVTNGDFSSGTTGWVAQASNTIAVVSGELEVTLNSALFVGASGTAYTLIPGKLYVATATARRGTSAANVIVRFGSGVGEGDITFTTTSNETKTRYFVATTTTTTPEIRTNSSSASGTIYADNISIKELTVTYVTAPDGTTTATEFTADAANATFTQSVTAIAAEYTFSVYLRRVTGTGDIDITAHSGGTWVTQSITSSWARYTVTQTLTAGTRTPGIRIVTSGDQIEVWGAQLEQRSSATAYTPTTTQPITNYVPQLLTAPAGVPRFDHNPTTGESLGLLVEEQRTNYALYSQALTGWTLTNTSGQAGANISPSGSLDAIQLTDDSNTGLHSVSRSFTNNQSTITFSFYVKRGSARYFAVGGQTSTPNVSACFDFDNPQTVTYQNGSTANFSSASLSSVGNGWYRVVVTHTGIGGSSTGFFYIFLLNSQPASSGGMSNFNLLSYTGTGALSIFYWGVQVEYGAYPTSYIPTTSASVTRTADDARMTGVNFSSWYRQDQGTIVDEHTAFSGGSAQGVWGLIGSSGEQMLFYTGSASGAAAITADTAYGRSAQFFTRVETVTGRYAFAYKVDDFAAVKNGGAVQTDTSGRVPMPINQLYVGFAATTQPPLNGHLRKLAYYPARLTNAQLQALTA